MRILDCGRYLLGCFAAAAMLAACGGSQPPTGASDTIHQSRAIAAHDVRGGSWMLPEANSSDLVYTSDGSSTLAMDLGFSSMLIRRESWWAR